MDLMLQLKANKWLILAKRKLTAIQGAVEGEQTGLVDGLSMSLGMHGAILGTTFAFVWYTLSALATVDHSSCKLFHFVHDRQWGPSAMFLLIYIPEADC